MQKKDVKFSTLSWRRQQHLRVKEQRASSSRQSVCIAAARVLGLCGRKSINTLLMLLPVCVLLSQNFLQDVLPATAFKAASQKRCSGLADSTRS